MAGSRDWEPREDAKTLKELEGLQFCWATGLSRPPSGWLGPWFLELAHLGSGSGSFTRVNDARGVVLLSTLAHKLHVAKVQGFLAVNGVKYPTLTNANVLYLKMRLDPGNYDPDFIANHWHGVPPIPEKPNEWFCQQMLDNKGFRL